MRKSNTNPKDNARIKAILSEEVTAMADEMTMVDVAQTGNEDTTNSKKTTKRTRKAATATSSGTKKTTKRTSTSTNGRTKKPAADKNVTSKNQEANSSEDGNKELNQTLAEIKSQLSGMNKTLEDMRMEYKKNMDEIKRLKVSEAKTSTTSGTSQVDTNGNNNGNNNGTGENGGNRMRDFFANLEERISVRRWMILALILLLLISMISMAAMCRTIPVTEKTVTVKASQGSIAVNGNVSINVYQDRQVDKEESATSHTTAPLISINYNGEDSTTGEGVALEDGYETTVVSK